MKTIKHNPSKVLVKTARGEDVAPLTINRTTENIYLTVANNETITKGDSTFDRYTPTSYYVSTELDINNATNKTHVITSDTPDIATVDQNGVITRLQPGVARFKIVMSGVTRHEYIDLTDITEGEMVDTFISAIPGTLVEQLSSEVDSRINDTMTISENCTLFSTQDHVTPQYVRNTQFWASDVDLTSISPWNSLDGNKRGGVAVTPRHVLSTIHFPLNVGTVVRFITNDNQVVERTVISVKDHPDYPHPMILLPDLRICTLDSDLPPEISPVKMTPSNLDSYKTATNSIYTRPAAIGLNQFEEGTIRDSGAGFKEPIDPTRANLYKDVVPYDSGNPACYILDNELILICLWTYGDAGFGTNVGLYISDINQLIIDADALAGVSTGYTVTEADFSAFPTV